MASEPLSDGWTPPDLSMYSALNPLDAVKAPNVQFSTAPGDYTGKPVEYSGLVTGLGAATHEFGYLDYQGETQSATDRFLNDVGGHRSAFEVPLIGQFFPTPQDDNHYYTYNVIDVPGSKIGQKTVVYGDRINIAFGAPTPNPTPTPVPVTPPPTPAPEPPPVQATPATPPATPQTASIQFPDHHTLAPVEAHPGSKNRLDVFLSPDSRPGGGAAPAPSLGGDSGLFSTPPGVGSGLAITRR